MRRTDTAQVLAIKIAIVVWGLFSALQGAALDAMSNDGASSARLETGFVSLVYLSVLVGGLFSFVSSKLMAVLFAVVTLIAVLLLFSTRAVNDGFGLGKSNAALILAIAIRPAASSLALFIASYLEKSLPTDK